MCKSLFPEKDLWVLARQKCMNKNINTALICLNGRSANLASCNQYQQAEIKAVMDKALQVLNETASELVRQNGRTELQKITPKSPKIIRLYKKDPANPDTLEKLNKDLDEAKNRSPKKGF